jgi:hypothetical protein
MTEADHAFNLIAALGRSNTDHNFSWSVQSFLKIVEMRGKDGKIHSATLDAVSAFDAAEKATRPWSLLYWYDPGAFIIGAATDSRYRSRHTLRLLTRGLF